MREESAVVREIALIFYITPFFQSFGVLYFPYRKEENELIFLKTEDTCFLYMSQDNIGFLFLHKSILVKLVLLCWVTCDHLGPPQIMDEGNIKVQLD